MRRPAFNFSRYLTRECGLHSRDFNFIVADRTVRIGVFPVGIETEAFAHLADHSVRLPFVQRVIGSVNGRALIIGVDRLDYSKGIPQRLSAFVLFLQTQPQWRGKVTYLQIGPKSRTEIPEYAEIEEDIGSTAGRTMAPLVRRIGRQSAMATVPIALDACRALSCRTGWPCASTTGR